MQLRQSHVIGILNNQRVDVGNVNASLNDGGAHQNINFAVAHARHDLGKLTLAHFAVCHSNLGIRQLPLQIQCNALDIFHTIVQIIALSAAIHLPPQRVYHHAVIVFHHIGLYRMTVVRRLFQYRHIANTGQRHIQGARNWCCRQRQHIDLP